MSQQASYRSGTESASHEPVTSEWGAAVLDGEVEKLRSYENDEFDKIFGVICRCVGAHKGGHISEEDLNRELGAACAEIRYRKLRYDLSKALVKVEPRGPKNANATEYAPSELVNVESLDAPWPDSLAVEALWNATVPCVLNDDAYRWLMLRGISPQEVEFQRLARFLGPDALAVGDMRTPCANATRCASISRTGLPRASVSRKSGGKRTPILGTLDAINPQG